VAPRVYCLLSYYPFFPIHFGVLYRILGHENLIRLNVEYQEIEANRLAASGADESPIPSPFDFTQLSNEILELLAQYHACKSTATNSPRQSAIQLAC